MSTKIILEEEVRPNPEPEENYDGKGRYLLLNSGNRPIIGADFAHMKRNNWISYWSYEWLEDMDMFTTEVGWRLTGAGVEYLKKVKYDVQITTLDEKEELARKAEEERKEKKRLQLLENEKKDKIHREMIGEIEKTLKDITFHGQGMVKKFAEDDYLENTPQIRIGGSDPDRYQKYGLTKDGRVFVFSQQFFDMWGSECSDQKAPKEYIELIKKSTDSYSKRKIDGEALYYASEWTEDD